MKKLTYLVGVLLLSGQAFADTPVSKPLVCRETNKRDSGYVVTVNTDRTKALVKTVSFTGAKVVAQLSCHAFGNEQAGMKTLYTCSDANIRDAGYSVRLVYSSKDSKPQLFAQLSEVSFVGAKLLTQLRCANY